MKTPGGRIRVPKLVVNLIFIAFVVMTVLLFVRPEFLSREAKMFANARPLRPENMPNPDDWKNERYFRKFYGLKGSNEPVKYIPTAPIHKGVL